MYEFLFEPCILRCLKYVYKKISLRFYDFTIRVYFVFSVPCQKCVFNNLEYMCKRYFIYFLVMFLGQNSYWALLLKQNDNINRL